MASGAKELVHEPEASRYVLRQGGEVVATVDYALNGTTVSMTRTFTRPTHRGRGLAAEVVAYAVDDVARSGGRVVPMCWYVAQWFDHHPERKELLA